MTAKRLAVILMGVVLIAPAAHAEYRLQVGDSVEFSVTGVPELKQRLIIGLDGEVSVPLVGQVKISGLPLDQARKKIVGTVPNLVYSQMTGDGREVARIIPSSEMSIMVSDYRPIYLRGDVAKPGEQPFRPGMTVRQALAVAGGFDLVRFKMSNPMLEAADLRAEYTSLWTDLAREQAHLGRIRAEYGGSQDMSQLPQSPIPPNLLNTIRQNEQEQLKIRTQNLQNEKSHLEDAVKKADFHLQTLIEKRKASEAGRQDDIEDHEKVRDLFNKGMTPTTRLSEARRAVLMSETQVLQTITEISQAERQKDADNRQLIRLDEDRLMALLKELAETNVKIAQIQNKLQSTGEKLLYTTALQSQLVQGAAGTTEMFIFRDTDSGRTRLSANEDTGLFPGDVIEVVMKVNFAPAASTQ